MEKDKVFIQSNRFSQIPVTDKTSEYKRLIQFLKEKNYEIAYHLQNIQDDDRIVAIVVDNQAKEVFGSNVTCMAAWCCQGTKYPLNVQEFIDNYDEFVIRNNIDKYYKMIHQKAKCHR